MNKRKASESEQFVRDVKSLRAQAYESAHEELLKGRKIETAEDATRLEQDVLFTSSMLRNRIDSIYPGDTDCGEVVAMGTEDSNACGLLLDPEPDEKLYEYEPTLIPTEKMNTKGDKAVVSVAAGGLHSVCLHRDGTVSTWGTNDEYALGWGEDTLGTEVHLIKQVKNIKNIVQIGAGNNHTAMLDIDGDVYSCGMYKDSDSGYCRDLKSPDDETFWKKKHAYPSKVLGLGKIVAIDAGKNYNAALDADGTLYTWGMGNSGELARSKSMGAELKEETYYNQNDSTRDGKKYKTYEVSRPFMGTFTEKFTKKGESYMDFTYNIAKVAEKFMTPAPVEWAGGPVAKRQVLNFSCGDIHTLVVACNQYSRQTQVFSAGCSAFGQLGHGDSKNKHELTPIEALNDKQISKVAAGNSHSLALSMNGRALFSWGKVDEGALGLYDGAKTTGHTPIDFVGVPTQVDFPKTLGDSYLVDIDAGETTSFAVTNKGEVYSWGYNVNSQTGHYNVPEEGTKKVDDELVDEHGNHYIGLIPRPRLLNVIAAVNDGLKREKQPVIAKNCRVTKVSGGSQHALMIIKRYQ